MLISDEKKTQEEVNTSVICKVISHVRCPLSKNPIGLIPVFHVLKSPSNRHPISWKLKGLPPFEM